MRGGTSSCDDAGSVTDKRATTVRMTQKIVPAQKQEREREIVNAFLLVPVRTEAKRNKRPKHQGKRVADETISFLRFSLGRLEGKRCGWIWGACRLGFFFCCCLSIPVLVWIQHFIGRRASTFWLRSAVEVVRGVPSDSFLFVFYLIEQPWTAL